MTRGALPAFDRFMNIFLFIELLCVDMALQTRLAGCALTQAERIIGRRAADGQRQQQDYRTEAYPGEDGSHKHN